MTHRLWKYTGFIAYWLLIPLIYLYVSISKPRARVLLTHDNHVLVVKNWLGANNWTLPGGGIGQGETPVQAAIREIKEELGFVIEPGAIRNLGNHQTVEKRGLRTKYYLFAVELNSKPSLGIKTNEIIDHKWLPVTDIYHANKGVSNTVKQSVAAWTKA